MAILGYNTKGASNRASQVGRILIAKYNLASPGTLTELHGWVLGGATAAFRVVLYDDDGGSGNPGTRLAYTASQSTPSAIDYEIAETGLSVSLAAGDYWVGWISQVAVGGGYYDAAGTSYEQLGVAYTPPPSPFGGPGTSGTRMVSCWGVVGAAASAFVPQVAIL